MVCVGGIFHHGAHDAVGWAERFSQVQPDLKQQTAGWWLEVSCGAAECKFVAEGVVWSSRRQFCGRRPHVEQQKVGVWQKALCGAAEGNMDKD